MVYALGTGNIFSGTIHDVMMCLASASLTCVMIRIRTEPSNQGFTILYVRCDITLVSRII
jgi:hypothetical protein